MNIDRTQKENIVYIKEGTVAKLKASSFSSEVTLEDMYNFVKDEISLAQYNPKNENEIEFDEEGFPMSFPTEVVKELGILGQDIISSQNIVVDFLVNAEDAFKRNSFLECNYNNYVNILAGALKQAIQKIEELERKISEKKEG